jgi:hypothetical protein
LFRILSNGVHYQEVLLRTTSFWKNIRAVLFFEALHTKLTFSAAFPHFVNSGLKVMNTKDFCSLINSKILCGYDSQKKIFIDEELKDFNPSGECL